jgi:hypothetical protein
VAAARRAPRPTGAHSHHSPPASREPRLGAPLRRSWGAPKRSATRVCSSRVRIRQAIASLPCSTAERWTMGVCHPAARRSRPSPTTCPSPWSALGSRMAALAAIRREFIASDRRARRVRGDRVCIVDQRKRRRLRHTSPTLSSLPSLPNPSPLPPPLLLTAPRLPRDPPLTRVNTSLLRTCMRRVHTRRAENNRTSVDKNGS